MIKVLIIDYGMGNLASVKNVLEKIGVIPIISTDPKNLNIADKIILPGVGAFPDAINNLEKFGWKDKLTNLLLQKQIPFLGICLGMQLLASLGTEGCEIDGLNFIKGKVVKLEPKQKNEFIPHVGWNEVFIKKEDFIFKNIPDKSDFYFVHSYHFIPDNKENILAITPYCESFTSVIRDNNIIGVQFHPEKSGEVGIQLIKNFLNI